MKIPKIRTLNGKILRHNGKIATSDDCCCDPCQMTARIFVDFECPCGGYGGADDESAYVIFTFITKDGFDLINGWEWPSYISSGTGTNGIRITGGETSVPEGYMDPPEGYAPGENRFVYTGPCGKEIFDENSLRVTSSNLPYGGIEFSKSWNAQTQTWTYHYSIKNGLLYNTGSGELYTVTRPVRIIVDRGPCCWNGIANDPLYQTQAFYIDDERKVLTATAVVTEAGHIVQTFDGGTTARVAVCHAGEQPAELAPDISMDNGAETLGWTAGSGSCCKDAETGKVYYCLKFECSYGMLVRYDIFVDDSGIGCACSAYVSTTWASAVMSMLENYNPNGYKFQVDCWSSNLAITWGETSLTGYYPYYEATAWCCCLECSEGNPPPTTISFKNTQAVTWNGAKLEVSGSSVTITPRIPIEITIPVTFCDGTAANADSCENLPQTLTASVAGETITLNRNGSTYSGNGIIDCTSGTPTVYISGGDGTWQYGYPKITSVTCDPYRGWIATGEARPTKRTFTLELVLDSSAVFSETADCVNPMYSVGGYASGTPGSGFILTTYSTHTSDSTTVQVCGDDPSCGNNGPYERGEFVAFNLDTTNQPGITLDSSGTYSAQPGAPYSVSWNSGTNTLTLTWKVICDPRKSIIKVPIPAECIGNFSYSSGWMNGNYWVYVSDGSNWPGPPSLCNCLSILDWPPGARTMTCSVGYASGTQVSIVIWDGSGYWQQAQANGISDFSASGTIDGQPIQFSFYNGLWSYSGNLPADATSMPTWTFSGPIYNWNGPNGPQTVPSKSGTLLCNNWMLSGSETV